MELAIAALRVAAFFLGLGFVQVCWGQTDEIAKLGRAEEAKTELTAPSSGYVVFGATAQQEALVRGQIRIMRPAVLPLRVVFVPHWKYIDNTRIFHLHVPAGYTSAMFSHLTSRTVFIDADRYFDETLGYWLAHELGHLATNSAKEQEAERAAKELRNRLKEAAKQGSM